MKETWEAIVFHSSLPGGKAACVLRVSGFRLTGETDEKQQFNLDLRQVKVTLGGTGNNLVYLKPEQEGGEPVFTVRDRSIMDAFKQAGQVDIVREVQGLQKAVWSYRAWLVWSAVALVLLVGGAVAGFMLYGVNVAVAVLPYSVDRQLGKLAFATSVAPEVKANAVDPKVQAAIETIVKQIVAGLGEQPFTFSVHVIASPQLNAFALPGGQIAVFTGLIKAADSAEEVAGVLAHEIIHVTERHGVKQIVQTIGNSLLLQAIFGDASVLGDAVERNAQDLLRLGYSRGMERQADREGFKLLVTAGIDPSGLEQFFAKLSAKAVEMPKSLEWFSTHPLTEERIQALRDMAQTEQVLAKKTLAIDWQEVRNCVK